MTTPVGRNPPVWYARVIKTLVSMLLPADERRHTKPATALLLFYERMKMLAIFCYIFETSNLVKEILSFQTCLLALGSGTRVYDRPVIFQFEDPEYRPMIRPV